ncbi:hypothetical protein ACDA63_01595 [Uliginosibacterium sp. sgz301328]|uniref:hypothetical protein n=1 Tax=Uliginosibacterium sp. sgz301328 TaxID=3243764 RepID=UPI00359DA8EB
MDPQLIQLIARLKIRLRQDQSISLNTQRFFEDSEYAHQVLDRAEESEDIELVSMSLEMRNRMGWLDATPTHASIMPPPPDASDKTIRGTTEGRYKFGARGG